VRRSCRAWASLRNAFRSLHRFAQLLFARGEPGHVGLGGADFRGEALGRLIELHVVVEEPGALHADSLDHRHHAGAAALEFMAGGLETLESALLRAAALFALRHGDAESGMLFGGVVELILDLFEGRPDLGKSRFLGEAGGVLFFDEPQAGFPLLGGFGAFLFEALELEARHREARVGPREFFGEPAHFVIERERFAFFTLLTAAERFELGGQSLAFALEVHEQFVRLVDGALFCRRLAGELAQFALERQGTGAGLASTRHRVAVIADAVGEQEVVIRILRGEALRGLPVFGDEAARQARQQRGWRRGEPVGHPDHVGETADDAGVGAERRLRRGLMRNVGAGLGVNEERRAAVEIGAHEVDAGFGFAPILHDHVLELFV